MANEFVGVCNKLLETHRAFIDSQCNDGYHVTSEQHTHGSNQLPNINDLRWIYCSEDPRFYTDDDMNVHRMDWYVQI